MTSQLITRRVFLVAAAALLCALYLASLDRMGMVSADEPRYAAIGRAMAQTGDWITPRLWERPWFEKPALLYWMIAAGFKAGFGPDLAPRLPVALLSLAFLFFFCARLRALWDARVALCSTAILATSAGWLAYSHVAVTDLPLAALFTAAVLLTLGEPSPVRLTAAAIALGLAVLDKSLVPVVLYLPVLALCRRSIFRRASVPAFLAFLAVVLPWHVLCTLRNGGEFLRVLFVEHQFGRFTSPALQHVQRWYFYFPALLLLFYPWSPLLFLAPRAAREPGARPLAAVFLFGFVFFSASTNKLVGYLLPLLPCAAALAGIALVRAPRPGRALILPVALAGALPVAAGVLPRALATGLGSVPIPWPALFLRIGAAAVLGGLLALLPARRAFAAAAALTAVAFLCFQFAVFPSIDAAASARPLWRSEHPSCAPPRLPRGVLYSLEYYAGRELPPCRSVDPPAPPVVR